ncbi:site-2 protease family protein [Herpetosiphon llansteffanensis]|uniref:site-2 protease family protein n=1 Tax=Herpetosiphon llansteffanensis TaxID=2094568 RepID=UPI000F51A933|nr:site-2 protease family protein [Herpetosiphon llansteffanensis]
MTSMVAASTNPLYTASAYVDVYPFVRQEESEEELLIGRVDTNNFIMLPKEAVEILDDLAHGKTIGEAQALYAERYGEIPDLVDLLEQLESEGFVQPLQSDTVRFGQQAPTNAAQAVATNPNQPRTVRFHFTFFPVRLAQLLFSPIALALYAIVIGGAAAIVLTQPSIVAGWRAMVVDEQMALFTLIIMLHGFVITFFHELGHAVAARSRGVDVRFGIGRRLWVIVAETDMSGIWSIKRNLRFLPILAGMVVDLLSAAIMIYLAFMHQRQIINLSDFGYVLVRAFMWSYLLNLLFQLYFFVRTDIYYFLSTWLRCSNLMGDTANYMINQFNRVLGRAEPHNQAAIPERERTIIKRYAFFWLIGRVLAFYSLFFLTLPILWSYASILFERMFGSSSNNLQVLDSILAAILIFISQAVGIFLWLWSLIRRKVSVDDI